MGVRKLYYDDSHRKNFEAVVTDCVPVKGGFEIVLDATAFYPVGGGQPSDTGLLGDSKVLSVREEGEVVYHLCDKPLQVGATVEGAIDWDRRQDFMQQRSGEHIVSGIIHQTYGYHNVGFHMGADVVTIDFDGPIALEDLQKIEDRANEAVWQNLPVKCYYPSRQELPRVNYRRKKDLPWPVRIVEIPGVDICACCGTQVKHTGEVGLIKLLSCVKFHEGVRIEMVCGRRAMQLLSVVYDQNRQVSQAFSAKIAETGQAARRINEAFAAEKFRATALSKRLFAYIAQSYAGKPLALHFEENLTAGENRELCEAIAKCAGVAVTLSGNDKDGYSFCVISRTEDARAIGAEAAKALQGRGGGKREAFQASIAASRQEIEQYFG